MRMRGLAGSVAAAALLACTAGEAMAASDPGWFDGHSTTERQAIVDYAYERTGHAPVYTGEAETMGTAIADSVVAAGEAETSLAAELAELELAVGEGVGLIEPIGATLPSLWAVGLTFGAGYLIGTGARALYAELRGPDDAATGGSPNWSWGSASFRPEGYDILYGATVQQSPGAYLYNWDGAGVIRWFDPPCSFSGFTPAPGARMQHSVPSTAECYEYTPQGWRDLPVYVNYPYLLESDLHPTGPLRPQQPGDDVDGWDPNPPDPGATSVEDDLDALDEDGKDLLRDEIDWSLTPGAQAEEEPLRTSVRDSEEDRACKSYFTDAPELDPGERSPAADPEAADWDYDQVSYPGVYNPLTRSTQTVKVRWGTRSWGYRHIVLGHGWNAAAALRTGLALADRSPEVDVAHDPTGSSFIYRYDIPDLPNDMRCRQRVAVSYREDATVPVGRHVITSFVEAF